MARNANKKKSDRRKKLYLFSLIKKHIQDELTRLKLNMNKKKKSYSKIRLIFHEICTFF